MSALKFRKRPVVIEAMRLPVDATPAQGIAVYQWIESHIGSTQPAGDGPGYSPTATGVTIDPADGFMVIRTLEGDMKVSLGDWVIRGVQGEFYPCKPDIFEATYEPVQAGSRRVTATSVEYWAQGDAMLAEARQYFDDRDFGAASAVSSMAQAHFAAGVARNAMEALDRELTRIPRVADGGTDG